MQSRGGDGNEFPYRVADQRGSRDWYNCGNLVHINQFCTEPARSGRGRGYSGGSSNRGDQNGRGVYWNAPMANVVTSAEGKQPASGEEPATSYANFVNTNEGNIEHTSIVVHKQKI